MVVSASVVRPVLGRPAARGVSMFAASAGGSDDSAARDVLFGDAGKPRKGGGGKKLLGLVVCLAAAAAGFLGVQALLGKKNADTSEAPQVADASAPAPAAPAPTDEAPPALPGEPAPLGGAAPEGGAAPDAGALPAPAEGPAPVEGAPPAVSPAAPPDAMAEFAGKPRTKEAMNAVADALKEAGASEEAVAPMRDPSFLAGGDPLSKVTKIVTDAGLSEGAAQGAQLAFMSKYSDVVEEWQRLSTGTAVAGAAGVGPAPTGPALARIERRYPGCTFAEHDGNYVSSTGKLFVVSSGYVFPIERDFTVGRAF